MTLEMSWKILGAAIILLSAAYFSYIKISSEKNKIAELLAFIDLISEIENNIRRFSKPLPEILSSCNNSYFNGNGLIDDILTNGAASAIDRYSFFDKEGTAPIIRHFFSKIGEGYLEDEVNLCTYTLEKLQGNYSSLASEEKNTEKLYRSIPILAALSVILMLI